ncbi:DUF3667 domain-containing protein [Terrilactibacillus laevilacticus]|uniref:DUF3667 domain-containing protein n=1 Tax=Terrilactibacillus laevilacticus TaxID=1380157 RepID=A0ABW5PQX7_9BACI
MIFRRPGRLVLAFLSGCQRTYPAPFSFVTFLNTHL